MPKSGILKKNSFQPKADPPYFDILKNNVAEKGERTMEMATFENFKKVMESLTMQDDEYVLVRHLLKPGEKIRPHYHPKATEWLIIDKGIFDVRVENERRGRNLTSQTTVFLFPKGKNHAIEAITKIEYFVLRDKKDKTIYVK